MFWGFCQVGFSAFLFGKTKTGLSPCFSFTIVFTVIRVRTANAFTALFLLLEDAGRRTKNDNADYGNYNYIYHTFFLALRVIRTQINANAATAHPPKIAGSTASDAGETISIPTV